ncbi:unknown protein [Parachlamydia acanthamoebae UV-7]|uniref:Uncharacterized protein n=1 Tax=Parachlamydia acanthamoebae (strain UV7) TaxID=765952 RepID=F8L1L7_PARAV|nr:unknown protein [Parachlamydia acanthamoebae UV-7]
MKEEGCIFNIFFTEGKFLKKHKFFLKNIYFLFDIG